MVKKTVRRPFWATRFDVQVSLAALAIACPVQALAQCTPDPIKAQTPITCSGSVTSGIVISTNNSPLTLAGDASLSNTGSPAISVSIPTVSGVYGRYASITVNGTVSASGASGILLSQGAASLSAYDMLGLNAQITVAKGGSISGTSGITLAQGPSTLYGPVYTSIDNAGAITGSTGFGLNATGGTYGQFTTITNRATGTIGAIAGSFTILNNAGLIDGGGLSAIDTAGGYSGSIINAGTIRAGGAPATIANVSSVITNSATIANTGSGAAISGSSINLTNQLGGTVSAATGYALRSTGSLSLDNAGTVGAVSGATTTINNRAGGVIGATSAGLAINSQSWLNLVNAGAINGDIITGASASSIDSTVGTITGNVYFGGGNDALVAKYSNGALVTGISGSIFDTGGTNRLTVLFSADATLAAPLPTIANFNQVTNSISKGVTVTLANGFANTGPITLAGEGRLVNDTALTSLSNVVTSSAYSASFTNNGALTTTAGGDYAVNLTNGAALNNTGTINAAGGGAYVGYGAFTNSGTITASGVGVYDYNYATFNNSGTIRSTGDTALMLNSSNGPTDRGNINSGTIAGATVGANLGMVVLANTGSISGSTGVLLNFNATIDNRAGGTISGTGAAIANSGSATSATVINAGMINGNVNLATNYPQYFGSSNTYWAKAGGVLNGNLTLGQGDMLITGLSGSGTSGYAGINGTVSAFNSVLRYDVANDASATLAARAGFSKQGYQVASGATLNLNTDTTYGTTLDLAGQGSVVFNGSINTANAPALQIVSAIQSGTNLTNSAPTITNNGTLATTRNSSSASGTTVQASGTLINNGTIRYTDTTGNIAVYTAITGSAKIVNTGAITAQGGNGVLATTLTNSGTITASNAAVVVGSGVITNSGTIISTGTTTSTSVTSAAIGDTTYNYYGSGYTLNNLAGGVITGVDNAILTSGGTVSNAGTINGNVNLALFSGYVSGTYIANGGTLNGNLKFGASTAYLVETGSGFGVTGAIEVGNRTNWIGHQRTGTATVNLGGPLLNGFTNEFTIAAGAASAVTITGQTGYTGNIYVGGDGAIINRLATTGAVYGLSAGGIAYAPYIGAELAGFSNQANIGTANLVTSSFDNSATIGSDSLIGAAVYLNTGKSLAFKNTGTILNSGTTAALTLGGSIIANSTFANSGTITGGVSMAIAGAADTAMSITNSGTINGYTQTGYAFSSTPPYFSLVTTTSALTASVTGAKSLSLNNSGTIKGDINLAGAAVTLVNTGAITGNITTGIGNDSIALNGAFSGKVDGGGGTNALSINAGTQAAPVAFGGITNMASLTQTGGFATLSGIATLGSATLNGGRLVGLAGSAINAPLITVGSQAIFGSAGTVNGNLAISGVLSPGASPGTMTVNGNVALNNGSTSLFEITPTASDKLIVNGKLIIASGSTLQIAASTPVKAGTTLNLISATGGITGAFDAVTGLAGVVKPLANNELGLLVQFANAASYTPQVQRAIAYVNNAMAASSAPAALFPALSALQDGNAAPITSAFAQITPEPYADAMEIGTETALSLAGSARNLGEGEASGRTHLFAFGQALGSMRQFAGDTAQGVARATINGFGGLGGLGVAGEGYALSAYVGWVDQNEALAALGASTHSRGAVGGVAARFDRKRTRLTLSAAYDDAHLRVRRYVPDAGNVEAGYAMPSWSFDASLSHALPLGAGWLVRPQVGTTWVMTRHDAITEASGHPFALSVEAASRKQGFVDAGLSFETAPDAAGPWRRFLQLGARYRVQGEQASATAALAGYNSSLVGLGVTRNRLDATVAAGVEYRIAPGASLFLIASGELGIGAKRESVTGGVRFRL